MLNVQPICGRSIIRIIPKFRPLYSELHRMIKFFPQVYFAIRQPRIFYIGSYAERILRHLTGQRHVFERNLLQNQAPPAWFALAHIFRSRTQQYGNRRVFQPYLIEDCSLVVETYPIGMEMKLPERALHRYPLDQLARVHAHARQVHAINQHFLVQQRSRSDTYRQFVEQKDSIVRRICRQNLHALNQQVDGELEPNPLDTNLHPRRLADIT